MNLDTVPVRDVNAMASGIVRRQHLVIADGDISMDYSVPDLASYSQALLAVSGSKSVSGIQSPP